MRWHTDAMPTRSSKKPRRDVNEIAATIVAQVTEATQEEPAKNPAAVALGRLGGLKGGTARKAALSEERRQEIAKQAAQARWAKHKK